ncbi:MAG: Glu-tRNA(Gln) amidotransferase subunit GatD [Thermoplasmatota archaeon]
MDYSPAIEALLHHAGAKVGDEVEITTGDGRQLTGLVMEHHAFSAPDTIVLKLPSGYNVGVHLDPAAKLRLVRKVDAKATRARELPQTSGRPTVALLGTGGTIASYVDYRTGAVHPATRPEELALAAPEIFDIANVRPRVIFQVFSEDLQPEHWQRLAREVKAEFDAGARGVVIPHGTDTMGFTAAALAFFLRDLPGPVVLVGAQRSSDRPSSDAGLNLRAAIRIAATTDIGEVIVVMHADENDELCVIHRGVRVRKLHTSRRDAFRSVNSHPLGTVTPDGKVDLREAYRKATAGPVVLDAVLDEEVAMIQSYPGLWPEHVEKVVLHGVVIVGTGLGHIARRNTEMIRAITTGIMPGGGPRIRYDGRPAGEGFVVMASQCINGRTNMKVYSTGRDLVQAGCIEAGDMLAEVAYVKLMWVLGHTKDRREVERLMTTSLVGELDERSPIERPYE